MASTPPPPPPARSPARTSKYQRTQSSNELDSLLSDLSPRATLRVLKTADAVNDAARSTQRNLSDSVANVAESDRALGIRAALAAKKLREWHAELRSWSWSSRQYEPPAKQAATLHSTSPSPQFVDDRYDMTYWGSLPAATVQAYETRLETILDEMDALGLEELKAYVRKAHLPQDVEASLEGRFTPTKLHSNRYSRLDDFTVLITATIMQALPFLSRVSTLIELWQTRLLVLRQVPVFLHRLEDASVALQSAQTAVGPDADADLTRDSYITIKDLLATRTTALAQTLDGMLDVLEGRPDTLPDHWIDEMEDIESSFQDWVVQAEQVVMSHELDELRSIRITSSLSTHSMPAEDKEASNPAYFSGRKLSEASSHGASQSDATAVGDEDDEHCATKDTADLPKTAQEKSVPGAINIQKASAWDDTEAIKAAARGLGLSHRASFSYSDMSDEPEVVQTAQIQYVCLSPTATSPGIRPSIVEISSSKRSSEGSASPALTRTESSSTHDSSRSQHQDQVAREPGVSGPPAILAPWPPPQTSTVLVREKSIAGNDAYYDSSDSEDEGGLRSYASSVPAPRANQDSKGHTATTRTQTSASGPTISLDDFFDAIVQPLSGKTSVTSYENRNSLHLKSQPVIPSRFSSSQPKSRSKRSSRAVSQPDNDLGSQLNSRISRLLNGMHAPICFHSGSSDNIALEGSLDNSRARQPLAPSPAIAGPSTSSYTSDQNTHYLRPAPNHADQRHHFAAHASSRSTQSQARLYYLYQTDQAQPPLKLYVRLVGDRHERVMVRVGGGWRDLSEFLYEYAAHHGRNARIADGSEVRLHDVSPDRSGAQTSSSLRSTWHSPRPSVQPYSPSHSARRRTSGKSAVALTGVAKVRKGRSSHDQNLMTTHSRTTTPSPQLYSRPLFTPPRASSTVTNGRGRRTKNISPRKKAWVDGVMSQARKVSAGASLSSSGRS